MTDAMPAFGEATIDDCAAEPIHLPGSVQPHAALLAIREGSIEQASANAAGLLGVDSLEPGDRLREALGADLAAVIETMEADTGPRRHHRRLTSSSDQPLDVTATLGVHGQLLVEVEPTAGAIEPTGAFQDLVSEALVLVNGATDTTEVVDRVAGFVRELTGFDRVMGYRFAHDDHGEVVAEHCADGLESFLGLHYPASDIPPQARRLYREQWLRLIPDVAYEPVPVCPTLVPGTEEPLDMSTVGVRSVSPIHCEYLTNMGVRSSMSISLVVEGRLWGLIACHHYQGPHRPSVPVREACEFVALAASVMLGARLAEQRTERNLRAQRIQRRLAEQLLLHTDLLEGLTDDPDLLLDLHEAGGAAIVVGGRVSTVGVTPSAEDVRRICEAIATVRPGDHLVTDRLADIDPTLGDLSETAAGVAALPLSTLQRNYLLWFRPGYRQEVRWAGEPTKAIVRTSDGGTRLAPRGSFAEWVETVEGRSRPWNDGTDDILDEVQRMIATHLTRSAEQLAQLNAELVRSNAELDAFAYVAAHDLKEPLRGMANYTAFLAEDYGDVLDEEGREQLDTMLKLSHRMTGLLTSLLDYARIGRSDLNRVDMTLGHLVDETRDLVAGRLAESGGRIVVESDGPLSVDPDLMCHVLMNLVSNGLKYNESETPTITIGLTVPSATRRGTSKLRPSVLEEREPTVVSVSDNGIGIPADRIEDIFRVFRRLHADGAYGGGTGAGLTIARRVVERHGGTLWVESDEGEGSTFYFTTGPNR